MTDAPATQTQAAAPAKKVVKPKAAAKPKTAKAAKPAANHPRFLDMIVDALRKLNEKSGSSRQAIVKYIVATYHIGI